MGFMEGFLFVEFLLSIIFFVIAATLWKAERLGAGKRRTFRYFIFILILSFLSLFLADYFFLSGTGHREGITLLGRLRDNWQYYLVFSGPLTLFMYFFASLVFIMKSHRVMKREK